MNKFFRLSTFFISLMLMFSFVGCKKLDEDYGKSVYVESNDTSSVEEEEIVYPEIKSSDEIMPNYLDISRYDELNYSSAYLGENYKFKITYAGSVLTLPTDYDSLNKLGWSFIEGSSYNSDSVITAGKNVDTTLVNEYGKKIDVVFCNSSKYSKKLNKCSIVKLILPENCLNVSGSEYGLFWVNGVTNQSAINNIIEYWGIPTHFYAISKEHYYFDYFLTKDNKKDGVTIHVDPQNDVVLSIQIADYQ